MEYRQYLGNLLPPKSQVKRMRYKKKRPVRPKAASSLVRGRPLRVLMMTL